ncbi:MAG: tripartite tricarboxylate transporter substrate binding protein [bacterium]
MRRNFQWMGGLAIFFLVLLVTGFSDEGRAADSYPTKPITVVICYQPGSTDVSLRLFTERMASYLGQPMAFVYKPGAAGAAGGLFAAKSQPDGYTLIGGSQAPLIISPLTKDDVGYSLDDFVPVVRLANSVGLIAVKAGSPWKTLKDLVEDARKSPGKITFSTSGVFSSPHLKIAMFLKAAGVDLTHVPTTGSTPAMTALLGGHVQVTSSALNTLRPHLKSGALRPLAFFEKTRLSEFPNVPTFLELGYPEGFSVWYGILAPKGTPKEIVNTIYEAAKKAITEQKKEIEDGLNKLSLRLDFLSPQEFTKEIREESDEVKRFIKELKTTSK